MPTDLREARPCHRHRKRLEDFVSTIDFLILVAVCFPKKNLFVEVLVPLEPGVRSKTFSSKSKHSHLDFARALQ